MKDKSRLMSVKELSQRLNLPLRTTYQFAYMNLIPGVFRIGKRWLFREDMIEEWIEEETKRKNVSKRQTVASQSA